jgi:HEAT repeat protein
MPLIRKGPETTAAPAPERPEQALAALGAGDADARWNAARGLAGHAAAVSALAQAARRETDPRVREALFTSLARIDTPEAADAVIAFVRSDDADVRTEALDALRIMIGAVRPRLPELLSDDDDDVRILCCDLVRELSSAEASRLLGPLLVGDSAPNVCAAAVDVLAEVGDPSVLPSLEACAARFPGETFLVFAAKVAAERIADEHAGPHG